MSRDDMDNLLDDAIKSALYLLESNNEFYPFGVVRTKDGEFRHIQLLSEEEKPKSDDLRISIIDILNEGVEKGLYTTVGVISDVKFHDLNSNKESDAVRVEIDDISSSPVKCFLPYFYENGAIRYGEILAEHGDKIAFHE